MHVLIVEDDEITLDVLKTVIEMECQARCYAVNNLEDALTILKGVHFDLLVADLYLDDVAIPIIQLAKQQKIPTVVISAASFARQKMHELGVEHFIQKPFEYETFVQVIESICVKNN
jgi:response regulator of citrate/malate metabolism